MVNDCLNDHTNIRPIFDPGLNQMDIHGDEGAADGYFESGRKMLTMHHWKSWYHFDVPTASIVTQVTGDEGLFMRWIFDGGFVLSNGYSICEYVEGTDEVEWEKVEITWVGDEGRYVHRFPLRQKMGMDKKRTSRLVESEAVKGGVRQVYLERAERDERGRGIDRVWELIWVS